MADLLSTTRAQIEERLQELRPLVAEVEQLERALAALQALDGPVERPRSRPAAPPAAPARRRGAPRGPRSQGNSRRDQFLQAVRETPGITVSEVAKRMDVAPNYLYRIASSLEAEGTLTRQGRGYTAPGGDGPAAPGDAGPSAATVVELPAEADSGADDGVASGLGDHGALGVDDALGDDDALGVDALARR